MDLFLIEKLVTMFFETALVIITGLVVTGKGEWNLKLYMRLSGLSWIFNVAVRELYELFGFPLGTHTFIFIALMIMILKLEGKFGWFRSITAILLSFILLFMGEGLILLNWLRLNNISFESLLGTLGGRLLGQLLTDSLMIIVLIFMKWGRVTYGFKKSS